MSDKKITQLTALTGANAVAGDQLAIVDVSDTTMSASGTTKKIALSELQAAPLSAGTANGVAFLNASKVLTTGSALVFDGTTLALKNTANLADNYNTVAFSSDFTPSLAVDSNISGQINFYNKSNNGTQQLGVSIQAGATTTSTSPTALIGFLGLYAHFSAAGVIQDTSYLELYANTTSTLQGNAGLELRSGSTASSGKSLFFYTDDGNTEAYRILSTGTSIWKVGGSEQMRLTSTGLGIGTSSPSAKLAVSNAGAAGLEISPTSGYLGGAYLQGYNRSTSAFIPVEVIASSFAVVLASTQALTLDSSGNLGIGTSSPSASAILDAQSTTKGVRMPNMTTTQKNAIASPAAGLMVFDTTLAKLCVYTGAAWQTITSV
jgi:hypothetical protein